MRGLALALAGVLLVGAMGCVSGRLLQSADPLPAGEVEGAAFLGLGTNRSALLGTWDTTYPLPRTTARVGVGLGKGFETGLLLLDPVAGVYLKKRLLRGPAFGTLSAIMAYQATVWGQAGFLWSHRTRPRDDLTIAAWTRAMVDPDTGEIATIAALDISYALRIRRFGLRPEVTIILPATGRYPTVNDYDHWESSPLVTFGFGVFVATDGAHP